MIFKALTGFLGTCSKYAGDKCTYLIKINSPSVDRCGTPVALFPRVQGCCFETSPTVRNLKLLQAGISLDA